MTEKHFYFLNDQYYIDFPDDYLMQNKETIDGVSHDRPCYYAFKDKNHPDIYWMIPFSSQVEKFERIYASKVERYKRCDTIVSIPTCGKIDSLNVSVATGVLLYEIFRRNNI